MDPAAALNHARAAIADDDPTAAIAALMSYCDWRKGGGFEPTGGDRSARAMLDEAIALEATRRKAFNVDAHLIYRRLGVITTDPIAALK